MVKYLAKPRIDQPSRLCRNSISTSHDDVQLLLDQGKGCQDCAAGQAQFACFVLFPSAKGDTGQVQGRLQAGPFVPEQDPQQGLCLRAETLLIGRRELDPFGLAAESARITQDQGDGLGRIEHCGDHLAGFPPGEVMVDNSIKDLLVAALQPRQHRAEAGRQQPQTDALLHLITETGNQRHPPTDPALMATEQPGDFHLAEPVLMVQ